MHFVAFMCVCVFYAVSVEASRQDEPLPRRRTECLVTLFISSEKGRLSVDGMETEIFATLCWAYPSVWCNCCLRGLHKSGRVFEFYINVGVAASLIHVEPCGLF